MTAEEIIKKLEELHINVTEFVYELNDREEFGKTTIVHKEGDKEGGGEYSCIVRKFVDHDVYIEVTGFYSSYEGTDWEDGFTIVTPKEKTITVYE